MILPIKRKFHSERTVFLPSFYLREQTTEDQNKMHISLLTHPT